MGNLIWLISAFLGPLIWLIPHFMGFGHDLSPGMQSLLSGLSIVSAAFLLSWATELSEEYVPPSFALIILALISVLPEYAVDMHFAWQAGKDPTYKAFAVANMTGANRLLIGVGWSMLVFVLFFRTRQKTLEVHPSQRLELGFLLLATVYSLVLPIKETLTLADTGVFFAIFGLYVWRALKTEHEEHPLVGPALWMDERMGKAGKLSVIAFFGVYACGAIWFGAEPFAEGLVEVGRDWQIDEFILIQLVAPLASESPEFIVAILFVIRHRASTALGALVSSKVNQWTLLVGAIPIVYSLSRGEISTLDLAARPREELLLTAAQSLFAIVLLSNLRFTLMEAVGLFVLFVVPWFFPGEGSHYIFSAIYFVLAFIWAFKDEDSRRGVGRLLRLRG
ncbi:MAG: sodium:calcium antiporter [Proteobacteria bacterium]|nr:sodium:calcium antiporter [Pseudomonadota bacterium]